MSHRRCRCPIPHHVTRRRETRLEPGSGARLHPFGKYRPRAGGKASSGPSGSLLSRTAMAGPVVPTSTRAPPLSPPPGDHGVHRRAEDRPHPGGLRRDQERRPHPAGRTAAGIDRRRAADDGGIARLRPHRTRRLHRQPQVREQIRRSRDDFAIPPYAVARAIAFAVEQPYDVEIGDIAIRPASKASQRRSRRLAGCGMRREDQVWGRRHRS